MQQAEMYKLNLIETSDVFSPAALNENTQKVEAVVGSRRSVSILTVRHTGVAQNPLAALIALSVIHGELSRHSAVALYRVGVALPT